LRLDGRPVAALVDLDRAEALAAGDPRIAAERGLSLLELDCDDEAERELTRFLATGSRSTPVLAARARARARAGRTDESIADLDAAIALEPDPDLYLERSAQLRTLGRLAEAAEGLREGLVRQHGAAALHVALLDVEIAAANWDAALVLAGEDIAHAAVKTHAYLRRAEIFRAAGRKRDAVVDLERALIEADRDVARRPTGLALHARARVFLALGRNEAARRDLTSALERSPRFAEARELLASIPASNP
jgi:tetratricopeptide (TPR) repeat protein